MKKLMSLLILGLFLIILGCQKDSLVDMPILNNETSASLRVAGNGISPDEIEDMINGGVNWLLAQQNIDGSFSSGQEVVTRTGMAITKLCDRSIELNFQPTDPAGPYYDQINNGLNFILTKEQDKGFGKCYNLIGNQHHDNYNNAWALLAFAASRNPAYVPYAQSAADYFSNSQATNGGWGYNAEGNESWQDNSNTGYVALALVAARNFGCTVPNAVIDKLGLQTIPENFIDYIQNDANGGSGYQNPGSWVNMLKTGNLLFEMAFAGDDASTSRAQQAKAYLETHWNDPNQDPGFRPHNYQAMYAMMKGFTALGIDKINVGGPVDWYAEFVDIIDATKQGSSGMYYWPPAIWTDSYLSTVFALLTLEKIVELPQIIVDLDIKPTSCPNPFNMKANGVLPVAILGSADFDVSQINVSTIKLEGVSPTEQINLEDVAAPVGDPSYDCECTTEGPDGYVDLTLKFSRQDIASALGAVNDGDVKELTITGETMDGIPIVGKDCIIILKKGKK